MRKYFLFLSLVCFLSAAKAQQIQMTSLSDMQALLYNPSMAGVEYKTAVGVTYRSQWTGVGGSPKTATAFGSFDLPDKKIGLGGYIFNDQTGATSRTGIELAFAKHLPLNDRAQISLGLEAKGIQYSIDMDKLSQTLGSDPVLGSGGNKFKVDAGFGISYSDKNLQVGASVLQLIQSKLNYYSGTGSPTEDGKLYRHYYFHGAYRWRLDDVSVLRPSFMMVYLPNAPTEFQGEVRFEHDEVVWFGVGGRVHQGVILSAGVHIKKKFSIGYVFDIYKTPYSVYEQGSNAHELMVRYNLAK